MSYDSRLPALFPICVGLSDAAVAEVLAKLIAPDAQYTNGSSFAVTVDTDTGYRKLWLSQASAERLGF